MGRFRNHLEDTLRNGVPGRRQVGSANPTIGLGGALGLGLRPHIWNVPPPPLLMHLGPWLHRFDPTAHSHPTGL